MSPRPPTTRDLSRRGLLALLVSAGLTGPLGCSLLGTTTRGVDTTATPQLTPPPAPGQTTPEATATGRPSAPEYPAPRVTIPVPTGTPPAASPPPAPPGTPPPDAPRVFLLPPALLTRLQQRVAAGDPELRPFLDQLQRATATALAVTPPSVVDKPQLPPSGDRHDYISLARYWWPNPASADGLPYIERDGQVNPAVDTYPNEAQLTRLIATVEILALAGFLTNARRAAERAALLLRTWFLDPTTRMTPQLRYAEIIPGRDQERGGGIIQGRDFSRLLDAIGLVEARAGLASDDRRGLRAWFSAYRDWLMHSPAGRAEAEAPNNHGTWYDVQLASVALFTEATATASQLAHAALTTRIARQIQPDGRQPLELTRTRSWSYSVFNLAALVRLASLAERVGVDLWQARTADGRGLRPALDFLVPFAMGRQRWPGPQLGPLEPGELRPLLFQAAMHYPDAGYRQIGQQLSGGPAEGWLERLPSLV